MNGIDISHWQSGLKVENVPGDFVILKATEGRYYDDPSTKDFYSAAKRAGKLRGLYHFASGTYSGKREAEYFVDRVAPYIGDALLVLDWEQEAKGKGPAYAREFLDTVWELTGVTPVIYMSKSVARQSGWADTAAKYPLWVAQYASYNPVYGYQSESDIWQDGKDYGAWDKPIIRQYTSQGFLPGYAYHLDLDYGYCTPADWASLAGGKTIVKKSVDELAREVIAGTWGNGIERKLAIEDAGYDYALVQSRVNEMLGYKASEQTIMDIAAEVIMGLWGNGEARRRKLAEAGYDYNAVQAAVNERYAK